MRMFEILPFMSVTLERFFNGYERAESDFLGAFREKAT
jgi:hypothetical protein